METRDEIESCSAAKLLLSVFIDTPDNARAPVNVSVMPCSLSNTGKQKNQENADIGKGLSWDCAALAKL